MSEASAAVVPIGAGRELPREAGGKAHGLRLIARAGLHVPDAWVVLPGTVPEEISALAAVVHERGIRSLAVRSSAADEDGGDASFAGVHETVLGVAPARLGEAVANVAASAMTDRAASYRRQLGLPPACSACAVVVQEMVDADAAGVAFGRGVDEVVIEAVEGLGEIAVNGEAIPETVVLRRTGRDWGVVRRQPRRQRVAVRYAEAGPVRLPIEEVRQRGEVLTAFAAGAIAAGVSALEASAGRPLDVEWAISGGRVAFLQARPQTRPLTAALPPAQTWSRANLRETTPELPCAFTRSFFVRALDRGERIVLERQGLPPDPALPLVAAVHGRLVFNERVFFTLSDVLGMPESFRAWVRSFVGGSGSSNEVPVVSPLLLLRHPRLLMRAQLLAAGAERGARRYLSWLRSERARRGTGARRGDVSGALERIRRNPVFADSDRWIPTASWFLPAIANAHLGARQILRGLDAAALLPRLMEARDVSVSTRQLEDLVALALELRGWPAAADFLAHAPPEAERWAALLPAAAWVAVERWLRAYGHRGPWESDVSTPRYRDDLRLVAKALRPLVTSPEPPESPEDRRARRARNAGSAWSDLRRTVGPIGRARLRALVRKLARLAALREELRSDLMIEMAALRDDLREVGLCFAEAGRLDAPDDVFHLEIDEVERGVADHSYDVRAAAQRELARRAAWRRIEIPNRFTTEEIDDLAARALAGTEAAHVMRGTGVSPGAAEAPVSVLRAPDEGERMPVGAVLVAPATDPGWTPLFARASAVVVEIGGLFSHAATVAREFGLPAVSNVDGATDRLRDGDVVRVDGSRGVVEVISRAARG